MSKYFYTRSTATMMMMVTLFLVSIIMTTLPNHHNSVVVVVVNAQACTANAGPTPNTNAYLCPLGYVNVNTNTNSQTPSTTFECKKATDMQKSVVNSLSCQTTADCLLNPTDSTTAYSQKLGVNCANGLCVYANTRLPGDTCSWSGQCLGGRCDLLTNKCVGTVMNVAKKAQRCEVTLSPEGHVISCQENTGESLKCYQDFPSAQTIYKSCYAKKYVRVGESCGTWDNSTHLYNVCDGDRLFCSATTKTCSDLLDDGATCTSHKECKNGDCQLQDTNDVQSGLICKKLKQQGELCDSTTECSNLYSCRSTDAKSSRRCLPFAQLGEFCNIDADCQYNKPFVIGSQTAVSTLVVCSNAKCIRAFGQANGQKCEQNSHCYTGFCDTQTGNCANPPVQKCTQANVNDNCPFCACKDADNGVCVTTNNCPGYKLDLQICLYNNFVNSLTDPLANSYYALATRTMDQPFVDRDSSAYTKCRAYYTNYWSCMQNNDKWTVAEFEGFVPGVQPVPNLIMPKVLSGANVQQGSLVTIVILAVVAVLMSVV